MIDIYFTTVAGDNMSKWFYINFIVIIIVIWKFSTSSINIIHILGIIGFALFMFNWMRHAMFSTIRSKIPRKKKIIYAKFSKRAMPIHRWTGTIALVIIIFHAHAVIKFYGFQPDNYKMTFGLMALIMMIFTVILGWLRQLRTTVRRRILHLSFAFTLFYIVIIHIIL